MPRLALAALLLAVAIAGCGDRRQREDRGAGNRLRQPAADRPARRGRAATPPTGRGWRSSRPGARRARSRSGRAYLDDAKGKPWDPVAVGANARRAVQDSSAAAYIGELDSEPTRASVPITNDAGLVQVSPGRAAST